MLQRPLNQLVKKGNSTIGVKGDGFVVIAVEKKTAKKLQEDRTLHKISLIDEHILSAFTGLSADARELINEVRLQAQSFRLTYDEIPTVNFIT